MEILKFPHPSLFRQSIPVTAFTDSLKVLLDAMWDTMKANNGLGLAANQVDLPWRMFVMEGVGGTRHYVVNPKIILRSAGYINEKEGCLSAPGEFVVVPDRNDWVKIEYQDENGKHKRLMASGNRAICVQHEIEHLEGKTHLQSKSIPKSKRIELAKKWGLE